MNITYIHFHLKTGGVTTVLKQQAQAIKNDAGVLIISGSPPEASFSADIAVVPGLDYDTTSTKTYSPEEVAESITGKIYKKWKYGCDLIHVHNATLSKNKNLLYGH